jgi:hypothetical protein
MLGTVMLFSRVSELAATRTLSHDFVSYVLPASSFSSGLGAPYSDYWDLKPPLLLAHLVPWIELFGTTLRGFYVLYVFWLVLALFCAWRILRMLAPGWLAVAAFASATVVMPATGSLDMFFPSELPGLALVLVGLVLAIEFPGRAWALFAAAFAMTAAGQFKDVYMFAPLVLVAVVWSATSRAKAALLAAAGALAVAVLTIAYLLSTGSLGAYREVLAWKRKEYPVPSLGGVLESTVQLIWDNGSGLVLGLGGSLILAVLWVGLRQAERVVARPEGGTTGRESRADVADDDGTCGGGTRLPQAPSEERSPPVATLVLLLWLFLAAGFALQAKPTYAHYVISLQLPTILAVVAVFALVTQASRPDGRRATLAVSLLALACLIPKPSLVEGYLDQTRSASPRRTIDVLEGLERPQDLAPFRRPGQLTPPGRCLQVAYGWEAGAFHVYGKRPSCSRYFLSNLVNTPRQRNELGSQVIAGGPAVVVYRPQDADLVVPTYEHETFPWAKVLTDCYTERYPGTFVARQAGRAAVSACIGKANAEAWAP